MAAFTSKATGNWSASGQTTWNEVGVPGNGDTVTITHTVTVDANTVVGTSGASGTVAITISSPGVLLIAAGITLTCRGEIRAGTGGTAREVITVGAGATLEMDASQAASPTSQVYEIRLGAANGDKARFGADGTSGSRATVISNSGGGNAYFTRGGFTNTGHFLCEYCDFTRIGDGTRGFNQSAMGTSASTSRMDFTNCIFDACGTWTTNDGGTPGAAAIINAVNCTWKNTAGSGPTFGTGTSPSGTRVIKGCVFDKAVTLTAAGYSIGGSSAGDEVLFLDGFSSSGSQAWTLFQYVLARETTNTQETLHGDATDCLFLQNHTTANPHFVGMSTNVSGTLTRCLFRYTGTNFAGDGVLLGSPGAARTVTLRQCIVLPNGGGDASCSLVSALGNANISFSVEHCTMLGNGNSAAGVTVGETYAGFTGMCTSFKSNIVWKPSGTTNLKWSQSGTTSDIATAANLNYNAGWNLAAGSQGKGYTCTLSAGTPGANDVDEDPGFVDSSRTELTWDTALGGAGTTANAMAELAKKNDASGYNTAYTIQALIAYLRGGFAPTNVNLRGAAHDATDIGAVAFVVTGTAAVTTAPTLAGTGTVGAAGITGTGDAALTPALAGTGTQTFTGPGDAATLPILAGTGTAGAAITGTGDVAVAASLAGTGTEVFTGTGDAAVLPALAGTGAELFTGTGDAAILPTLAATGTEMFTGTGDAAVAPTLAGTGTETFTGTGDAAILPVLAASGGIGSDIAGTGDAATLPALSGSGTQTFTGTGDASVLPTLSGTGTQTVTGSGAVTIAAIVDGTGTQTMSGDGTVAVLPVLAATGEQSFTGTASVTVEVVLAGTGTQQSAGVGAMTVTLTLSGAGTIAGVTAGVGASAVGAPGIRSAGYVRGSGTGKYRPEHAGALVDVGAADDFSAEHASALAALGSAGV